MLLGAGDAEWLGEAGRQVPALVLFTFIVIKFLAHDRSIKKDSETVLAEAKRQSEQQLVKIIEDNEIIIKEMIELMKKNMEVLGGHAVVLKLFGEELQNNVRRTGSAHRRQD